MFILILSVGAYCSTWNHMIILRVRAYDGTTISQVPKHCDQTFPCSEANKEVADDISTVTTTHHELHRREIGIISKRRDCELVLVGHHFWNRLLTFT